MAKRKNISDVTITQVLVKSRRRCCLCFGINDDLTVKEGQIAHLDHNPNNNNEDNLAFLCLHHHNKYDSKTSQMKNLTKTEVKYYRKQLYNKFKTQPELGVKLQLIVDHDFKLFTIEDERNFINALNNLLKVRGEVLLIRKEPGSTKIIISLSRRNAELLLSYFKKGNLKQLKVKKIDYIVDSHIKNKNQINNIIESIKKIKILFLSANPLDTYRIRLDYEFQAIQNIMKRAKSHKRFVLDFEKVVGIQDIIRVLCETKPQIVHFAGNSTATNPLCLVDENGKIHPIQATKLATLFSVYAKKVNCVVLSTCYSEIQANAIAKHINYVIGINQTISDDVAIVFIEAFYNALVLNETIENAYEIGCTAIKWKIIQKHVKPTLFKKRQS